MIHMIKRSLFVAFIAIFATGLQAQTSQKVSDEKLEKFVEVSQKVQGESMKQQQKMMKVIQDEGLTAQRFNEIYKAQQNPNKESDASGKEKKQFKSAMGEIEAMNKKSQKKMEALIKKEGMEVDAYMSINQKLQQNKALQKRFRELMSAKQPQQKPQMKRPN